MLSLPPPIIIRTLAITMSSANIYAGTQQLPVVQAFESWFFPLLVTNVKFCSYLNQMVTHITLPGCWELHLKLERTCTKIYKTITLFEAKTFYWCIHFILNHVCVINFWCVIPAYMYLHCKHSWQSSSHTLTIYSYPVTEEGRA